LVLVDSHLWVEFLSGKRNRRAAEVERLLRADAVCVAGPILYELLLGPRTEAQREYLGSRLGALPFIETTRPVWLCAVRLGRLPSAISRQVPPSDVLIAAHCHVYDCALFTGDAHFDVFPELRRHRI
jgi:predicted nucleic acid-binding protein